MALFILSDINQIYESLKLEILIKFPIKVIVITFMFIVEFQIFGITVIGNSILTNIRYMNKT